MSQKYYCILQVNMLIDRAILNYNNKDCHVVWYLKFDIIVHYDYLFCCISLLLFFKKV